MNGTPPKTPIRPRFGNTVIRGAPAALASHLYARLLDAPWWRILILAAASYLATNLAFMLLYMLGGDCIRGARPGSYADAFYFSVQSVSTIGYGVMSPGSTYAHILVTIEAFVGMIGFAVGAGLVFAKFARPQASVIFSNCAVIDTYDGEQRLMFRVANWRGTAVVEARASVSLLRTETTAEGHTMRRLHDLKLIRETSPVFGLSWTVMHIVDADSPMAGVDAEAIDAGNMMLIVTLVGIDETYGQTVHAREVYNADAIRWNARFVDVVHTREDGVTELDLAHFHDTVEVPSATNNG